MDQQLAFSFTAVITHCSAVMWPELIHLILIKCCNNYRVDEEEILQGIQSVWFDLDLWIDITNRSWYEEVCALPAFPAATQPDILRADTHRKYSHRLLKQSN